MDRFKKAEELNIKLNRVRKARKTLNNQGAGFRAQNFLIWNQWPFTSKKT